VVCVAASCRSQITDDEALALAVATLTKRQEQGQDVSVEAGIDTSAMHEDEVRQRGAGCGRGRGRGGPDLLAQFPALYLCVPRCHAVPGCRKTKALGFGGGLHRAPGKRQCNGASFVCVCARKAYNHQTADPMGEVSRLFKKYNSRQWKTYVDTAVGKVLR